MKFTTLRLTGGGASNLEMMRIFASVLGVPAQWLKTTSSAALGAALMAWRAHQRLDWDKVVDPFTHPEITIDPDTTVIEVYKWS